MASVDVGRRPRVGLLQVAVSLAALAGIVWWGTRQHAPRISARRPGGRLAGRRARALRRRDAPARRALAPAPLGLGRRPRARRELSPHHDRLHGQQHAARARGRRDARDDAGLAAGGSSSARSSPSACSTRSRSRRSSLRRRGARSFVRAAAVRRRGRRGRSGRARRRVARRAAQPATARRAGVASPGDRSTRDLLGGRGLALLVVSLVVWLVEASVYLTVGSAAGVSLGSRRRALRRRADESLGADPGRTRLCRDLRRGGAARARFAAPPRARLPPRAALRAVRPDHDRRPRAAARADALAASMTAVAERVRSTRLEDVSRRPGRFPWRSPRSPRCRSSCARGSCTPASGSTRACRSASRTITGRRSCTLLRQDGSPPAYYLLLGVWIGVVRRRRARDALALAGVRRRVHSARVLRSAASRSTA